MGQGEQLLVVGMRGMRLCKLLNAVLHKLEDHEEDNAGPEGGPAHNGHVRPRPRRQRVPAAEVVCNSQKEPPARPPVIMLACRTRSNGLAIRFEPGVCMRCLHACPSLTAICM